MTPEERRWYISNQTAHIRQWMKEHDEEVKLKKLINFVKGADIDLQEAVGTLHGVARLIETRIGCGTLAESIRDSADRLSIIVKGK